MFFKEHRTVSQAFDFTPSGVRKSERGITFFGETDPKTKKRRETFFNVDLAGVEDVRLDKGGGGVSFIGARDPTTGKGFQQSLRLSDFDPKNILTGQFALKPPKPDKPEDIEDIVSKGIVEAPQLPGGGEGQVSAEQKAFTDSVNQLLAFQKEQQKLQETATKRGAVSPELAGLDLEGLAGTPFPGQLALGQQQLGLQTEFREQQQEAQNQVRELQLRRTLSNISLSGDDENILAATEKRLGKLNLQQLESLAATEGLELTPKLKENLQRDGKAAIERFNIERNQRMAESEFTKNQLNRQFDRAITDREEFNAQNDARMRRLLASFGGGKASSLAGSVSVMREKDRGQRVLEDLRLEFVDRTTLLSANADAIIQSHTSNVNQIESQMSQILEDKYAEISNKLDDVILQGVVDQVAINELMSQDFKDYADLYFDVTNNAFNFMRDENQRMFQNSATLRQEARVEQDQQRQQDEFLTDQFGLTYFNGEPVMDENGDPVPSPDQLDKLDQILSESTGNVYFNGKPVLNPKTGNTIPLPGSSKSGTFQRFTVNGQAFSFDTRTGAARSITGGQAGTTGGTAGGQAGTTGGQAGAAQPIAEGGIDSIIENPTEFWSIKPTAQFKDTTKFEKQTPGLDIPAKLGTEIPSTIEGIVIDVVRSNTGLGNRVIIEDFDGNQHFFNHLSSFSVRENDPINKGQLVGLVGNTGSVLTKKDGQFRPPTAGERAGGAGAHLDYRVKDGKGTWIDPKQFTDFPTPETGVSEEVNQVFSRLSELTAGFRTSQPEQQARSAIKEFGQSAKDKAATQKLINELRAADFDDEEIKQAIDKNTDFTFDPVTGTVL